LAGGVVRGGPAGVAPRADVPAAARAATRGAGAERPGVAPSPRPPPGGRGGKTHAERGGFLPPPLEEPRLFPRRPRLRRAYIPPPRAPFLRPRLPRAGAGTVPHPGARARLGRTGRNP